MNLQKMLDEALEVIQKMSPEELEAEFIKAGYVPTRRHRFHMSGETLLPTSQVSYCRTDVVSNYGRSGFTVGFVNESIFQLAA